MSSVEHLALCALVRDGAPSLRSLYAAGVTENDFVLYSEEFKWIERRLMSKSSLNQRVFRARFPDVEWMLPDASIKELAGELKEERAFEEVNALIEEVASDLATDNAVSIANKARERLSEITRSHTPGGDVLIEDWHDHVANIKNAMKLRKAGMSVGLKTGFPHLDHHWGGLMPGQLVLFLGRTGEGKSYKTMIIALEAKLQGANVGVFTPEMSQHEVRCRLHTVASAKKEIQEAVGIDRAFRNRALMQMHGFNVKAYERFCAHFAELPGRIHLLSGLRRAEQMTVGYIEDRIVELELDLVIIDPIYLLKPVRRYRDNPYAEVGATTEAIERVCEGYGVPIIITNQAHRQGGSKDDAPHKDRSYGSDVPAQLSDYVLGIKHLSEENMMICRCTKSRFGQEFRYELDFFPNIGVWDLRTEIGGSYFNGTDPVTTDQVRRAVQTARKGRAK